MPCCNVEFFPITSLYMYLYLYLHLYLYLYLHLYLYFHAMVMRSVELVPIRVPPWLREGLISISPIGPTATKKPPLPDTKRKKGESGRGQLSERSLWITHLTLGLVRVVSKQNEKKNGMGGPGRIIWTNWKEIGKDWSTQLVQQGKTGKPKSTTK